ncbi:MAG: hypothetical protein A2X51_12945 [Candidatus Rokubacteria bacterium GWC2_70_24]|nr:MAG: hypothetical protein A2X51_12945 [Candidatus Rokubacteria bacterium GWC2_70_24]
MSRHDGLILLIVDEVHHFGGGLRDEALEMAMADARLGLTATPPRGAGAAARLAELVGPTVFELAVGDLAGGFLASFDTITVYLDLSPQETPAYTTLSAAFTGAYGEFRRAAPDASWTDSSQHAARTPEGRPVLAAWRQMRRILAFTHAKAPRQSDSLVEECFAREFRHLAPEWDVVREPEPIAADGRLIFPDLALQLRSDPARRWLPEIVGFWTPDYVARKLALSRSARLSNLILCIDGDRNWSEADLPPGALVVRFRRRVDAAAVLRQVG